MDDGGEPRLIDFGLARLCHAWTDNLTLSKCISGTLQYMAPEQAEGEVDRISERTDVFGLGALLYYLLVGKAPYEHENIEERYERACRCEFDKSALRKAGVPAALERICLRAMQRAPEDRYPTADAMAADLERFAARREWVKPLVVMAGVTVLIVAEVFWVVTRNDGRQNPPTPTDSRRLTQAAPPETHVTAVYPERPLRHDFPFACELLGHEGASADVTLTEGQQIAFRLSSEHDCYVGIWHVADDGTVTQLFPNKHDNDQFVEAGKPRVVPGQRAYAIRATVSKGPEFLHVVATTQAWDSALGQEHGPYIVFATPAERDRWREQVKSLVLEDDTSAKIAERVFRLTVVPAAR
jgi:hypothetical protein